MKQEEMINFEFQKTTVFGKLDELIWSGDRCINSIINFQIFLAYSCLEIWHTSVCINSPHLCAKFRLSNCSLTTKKMSRDLLLLLFMGVHTENTSAKGV